MKRIYTYLVAYIFLWMFLTTMVVRDVHPFIHDHHAKHHQETHETAFRDHEHKTSCYIGTFTFQQLHAWNTEPYHAIPVFHSFIHPVISLNQLFSWSFRCFDLRAPPLSLS